MKVLIDVNLPPQWAGVLSRHGFDAVHWTDIGNARAKDSTILQWARDHDYIVFTHDLAFGVLLAMTCASGPSVLQVRTQDVMPSSMEGIVVSVLRKHRDSLEAGALVSVGEAASRVRILPFKT